MTTFDSEPALTMTMLEQKSRDPLVRLYRAILAACVHKPPDPVVTDDLVNVSATVEAVYLPERLVSQRGPQGLVAFIVPPDVRNTDQVQRPHRSSSRAIG